MKPTTPPTTAEVTATRRRLDAARLQFDQTIRQLYAPNGKPIFTDEIHRQKVDAAKAALRPVIEEAKDVAIAASTESTRLAVMTSDPRWTLPAAELARYNALTATAERDAARMPTRQLIGSLITISRSHDPALVLAYHDHSSAILDRYSNTPEWLDVSSAIADLYIAAQDFSNAPNPDAGADLGNAATDLLLVAANMDTEIDPPRALGNLITPF